MKERVLVLVVFILVCAGCGGKATTSTSPAAGSFLGLTAPQSLLAAAREASAAGETQLLGKDYAESLGCGNVAVEGNAVKYSPQCTAGAVMLADTAYAIYSFELPSYDGLAQLTLTWDTVPASTNLFIGLGDFDGDHWKWFQPADPTVLDFTQLDPYFSETGVFLAAVAVIGTDEAQLASLRLGEETEAPVAVLIADVLSGAAPLTVQFDASGSTDPGTGITLYEWDWDGDGTYDEDTGTTATASHVFESEAKYTVVLRVTGGNGATDTDSIAIISGDAAGWQIMAIPPGTCGSGHMLWDVSGNPAIVYLDSYSIVYRRAEDARGQTWGDPVVLETIEDHSFYGSRVALVDGRPAAVWFRMTETSFPSDIELHYAIAQDTLGAAWNTPTIVVEGLNYSDAGYFGLVDAEGYPAVNYVLNDEALYLRAADVQGAAWGSPVTLAESGVYAMSGLALVDGRPACALVYLSTDPYGCELRYIIADDAAGASFAAPEVALERQSGQIEWLNLEDINGLPGILYGDMNFMIGGDGAGTSWSSPVQITTGSGMPYVMELAEVGGHPAIVCGEWTPYTLGDVYYARADDALGASWPAAQLVESLSWTNPEYPFAVVGVGMVDGLQAVCYGGYVTLLTLAVYE